MRLLFYFLIFFILICETKAQTYTGTGGPIPDDGNSVVFPITVSGLSQDTLNNIFGLESVCIDAIHTWLDDLTIILIAPDSTQVLLVEHNGGDTDYYSGTCFNDVSSDPIHSGSSPFTGLYLPEEDLGYINNKQIGNGTWYLYIIDTYPFADAGTLIQWNITFGPNPATVTPFVSSDLPIVMINTNGKTIVDDPKILTDFLIIDNGPGIRNYVVDTPLVDGHCKIEIRGSSSQMFPKKSYGFESCDSTGIEMNASWFGMPAENDWILNANYSDKTLMRNTLTYYLWNNMGHYGSRCAFCELMVNKRYKGIYIFMEKIKRDYNRVNISKLTTTDNSGDDLTGGYIFKIDKATGGGGDGWTSNYLPPVNGSGQTIFFQYEYPDQDVITIYQKNYIQAYVDSFETALISPSFADTTIGFRKYASDNSFIDYFILNELAKNIDGYRLSTFLHKNKNSNGGKLKIGPVWDFDLGWRNADYYGGNDFTGWSYQFNASGDYWQVPFWWQRFLQDTLFKNDLRCRWEYLRNNILSEFNLYHYVDSISALLNEAKDRNFETWNILGTYVWPNPSPIPATYNEEIQNLKIWISDRLGWLDNNVPGICSPTFVSNQVNPLGILAYPNPSSSIVFVEVVNFKNRPLITRITDMSGRIVLSQTDQVSRYTVDVSRLQKGVYELQIISDGIKYSLKLVVIR